MIIFGASGHAKVIIDIVKSIGLEIDFLIDDDPRKTFLSGIKVNREIPSELEEKSMILAIGNNAVRKKVFQDKKYKICSSISHTSAIISPSAKIGEGTVVMANACINSDTVIGKNSIINTGAVVEHDGILDDFVHISPNAALAGNVHIGEGTHIGIGAVVIQGIKIGKWVTVGAGAVIIEDIPDNAVVVGNPGRIIKYKK